MRITIYLDNCLYLYIHISYRYIIALRFTQIYPCFASTLLYILYLNGSIPSCLYTFTHASTVQVLIHGLPAAPPAPFHISI